MSRTSVLKVPMVLAEVSSTTATAGSRMRTAGGRCPERQRLQAVVVRPGLAGLAVGAQVGLGDLVEGARREAAREAEQAPGGTLALLDEDFHHAGL